MASNPSLFGVPLPNPYDPEEWRRLRRFGPRAAMSAATAPFTMPFAAASQAASAVPDLTSLLPGDGSLLRRSLSGGIPGLRGARGDEPYFDIRDALDTVLPTPPPGGFTPAQAEGREPIASPSPSPAQPSVAPTADVKPPVQIPTSPGSPPSSPSTSVASTKSWVEGQKEKWGNIGSEFEQAASDRSATRAVRLPNGRLLFTNIPSDLPFAEGGVNVPAGSENISGEEGAREYRMNALRSSASLPRAAITGLLQAQVRAAEREAAGGQPGGYSQTPGTPEIQNRLALENATGALSLLDVKRAQAETEQKTKLAEMDPLRMAAEMDPNLRLIRFIQGTMVPQIREISQRAAALRAKAQREITDKESLRQQIENITAWEDSQIEPLNTAIASVSRQRLPTGY